MPADGVLVAGVVVVAFPLLKRKRQTVSRVSVSGRNF
ncbi:DUF3927 family protein [Shigella flexneri]